MKKNFYVEQAIYIYYENQCYDIHNHYDFIDINIKRKDQVVRLTFELNKNVDNIENKKDLVIIEFLEVGYFEISREFIKYASDEIVEIGYKSPEDYDNDWLIDDAKSKKTDHLFFRFINDEYIRIYSKYALLKFEDA